jgi:hypothetical protein
MNLPLIENAKDLYSRSAITLLEVILCHEKPVLSN